MNEATRTALDAAVALLHASGITREEAVAAFDDAFVRAALQRTKRGRRLNVTSAARMLGVHRNTLHALIKTGRVTIFLEQREEQ